MKLQFGQTLRQLRRDRDLTQEDFAEILNVSSQSVSRWENDICYPDVELLPVIASFFETSVDNLLGITQVMEEQKVSDYLRRFQEAISVGNIQECIEIARQGVSEFPGNFQMLNKLMYALFASGSDDADIPEWKENMKKYDAEIVALGERIMKYCPDQDIRLEATARLGFHHCEMGRRSQGRAIYETLPSLKYCKETQIWKGLDQEEKLPYIRQQINQGCNALGEGMYHMIEGRLLPDEALVKVYEKIFALDRLVYDGDYPYSMHLHKGLAVVYARLGKKDEALKELEITAQQARAFDKCPENWSDTSLLMGKKTYYRTDYETADSRPLCRIMADTWMNDPDFDDIRETPEFIAIQKSLI